MVALATTAQREKVAYAITTTEPHTTTVSLATTAQAGSSFTFATTAS